MSPSEEAKPRTLFDKIWQAHLVREDQDGTSLLYIDRHLVHEVTSPQAFEGLRMSGRKVHAPEAALGVVDHNVPTLNRKNGVSDPESRLQIETLEKNCKEAGIRFFGINDRRQGIVHVIGPEQGFTLPGMTIVCGDSHSSTHGAFGALAFGIGTSEVEHVLATQTLIQKRARNMRISINGKCHLGISAKDLILALIGQIGTAGGTGYVIEYAGEAIEALSMEGRMTICNMSIEAGAKAGLIAPDEKTFAYVRNRPLSPKGEDFEKALDWWKTLPSDEGAVYDHEEYMQAEDIAPQVTWGTSPQDVIAIHDDIPDPAKDSNDEAQQRTLERSLNYMGLKAGQKLLGTPVDKVFIGSCTNGRIEDLRMVADIVRGKKVASGIQAMVVPGSGLVRHQAAEEGIDKILIEAGFEWREAGCSMCLAMNADKLMPGERCASTSNRNFEGRQGRGGRTHLMSPAMAAVAALNGCISDIRDKMA